MRALFKIVCVLLLLLCVSASAAFARSGCCSHHGGVCGCGCCDGASLSATCAPYYPECSSGSGGSVTTTNTYVAPASPKPTIIPTVPTPVPTPVPSPIPTPLPSPSPTPTPSPSPTLVSSPEVMGVSDELGQNSDDADNNSAAPVGGLALLGAAGYGGYKWLKGKKQKEDT